jgi:hypothetical protein
MLFFALITYDGESFDYEAKDCKTGETDSHSVYKYLKHFTGDRVTDEAAANYDHYVLVNDDTVTWERLEHGMFSSELGQYIPFVWAYMDLSSEPAGTPAPETTAAPYESINEDAIKLAAFLDQKDENGVSNRERICSWVALDPETGLPGTWSEEGRLIKLALATDGNMTGDLDLSGCDELEELSFYAVGLGKVNVSGCSKLVSLDLDREGTVGTVASLDVSGCTSLEFIYAAYEELTELDLSDCTNLKTLACSNNKLRELDLSGCPELDELNCGENLITTLDLSRCPKLTTFKTCGGLFDLRLADGAVHVLGYGSFGAELKAGEWKLTASPEDGGRFMGWFDEAFEPLSEHPEAGSELFTGGRRAVALFTQRGYWFESEYYAYSEAAGRLLAGEAAAPVYSCDVVFHLDDDAFRAYAKMTVTGVYSPELGDWQYSAEYEEPIAEYPREVGELALRRLYGEIAAGYGASFLEPFEWAEGFAGEDWFVLKNMDDTIQDFQISCIFRREGGEWYEFGDNNEALILPLSGACIVDKNTGFLSYSSKFLDEPDGSYRKMNIYRTDDGGRTWYDLGLVLPEEYGRIYPGCVTSPVFSGEHGVMFVDAYPLDGDEYAQRLDLWYESFDGGMTWELRDEGTIPME